MQSPPSPGERRSAKSRRRSRAAGWVFQASGGPCRPRVALFGGSPYRVIVMAQAANVLFLPVVLMLLLIIANRARSWAASATPACPAPSAYWWCWSSPRSPPSNSPACRESWNRGQPPCVSFSPRSRHPLRHGQSINPPDEDGPRPVGPASAHFTPTSWLNRVERHFTGPKETRTGVGFPGQLPSGKG